MTPDPTVELAKFIRDAMSAYIASRPKEPERQADAYAAEHDEFHARLAPEDMEQIAREMS